MSRNKFPKMDITGQRYGALVAIYPTNRLVNGGSGWMFRCDCGNEKELPMNTVRYGTIKSCGCHINRKKPIPKKQRVHAGEVYGKLTVLKNIGHQNGKRHYCSMVKCECGNEFITQDTLLVKGRKTQCSECSKNDRVTHGMTDTSLFHVWQGMRARCKRKSCAEYKYYGGRGIKVCEEWDSSFISFSEWALSNGYQQGLSIDRIDVNGNYEPRNCRWADTFTQANNKRNTVYIDYEGQIIPLRLASKLTGINAVTIRNRMKSGWSDYEATHTKVGENRKEQNGIQKQAI